MKIPVEISARHIHLSEKDFKKLFGNDKTLIPVRKLSQPGEFASKEKVVIINSDKRIENVSVIGPFRNASQAEISLTDAYNLKLKPIPNIKVSGDVSGAEKILIKGQNSSIKIPCIIAKRHLHCSENEAKQLKLGNNQKISVKIKGIREITFHEIIVRISKDYRLALHLDTDEGNSAGIFVKTSGEIIK